jgi:ABC-2 type transport system permease protein
MPSHNCKDVSEAKRSFRMTCPTAACSSAGTTAVLTGHDVGNVLRTLFATVHVILVAIAIRFRPIAKPASWLEAIGVIVLLLFAISWLSTAHGLLSKSPATAGRVTIIPVFLPYLSSAFVPTKTMLVWLQPSLRINQ